MVPPGLGHGTVRDVQGLADGGQGVEQPVC